MSLRNLFEKGFIEERNRRGSPTRPLLPYTDANLEALAKEAAMIIEDDIRWKFHLSDTSCHKVSRVVGRVVGGFDIDHEDIPLTNIVRDVARDLR